MNVHAISWFEIPATDFTRAKKFYSTILDLEIQEQDMAETKMGFFPADMEKGGVSGAIVHGEDYEPAASGSIVYLDGGKDLTSVLNRIENAGGKIVVPKTEIGSDFGFFAHFLDTEGNKVGLYSGN